MISKFCFLTLQQLISETTYMMELLHRKNVPCIWPETYFVDQNSNMATTASEGHSIPGDWWGFGQASYIRVIHYLVTDVGSDKPHRVIHYLVTDSGSDKPHRPSVIHYLVTDAGSDKSHMVIHYLVTDVGSDKPHRPRVIHTWWLMQAQTSLKGQGSFISWWLMWTQTSLILIGSFITWWLMQAQTSLIGQ